MILRGFRNRIRQYQYSASAPENAVFGSIGTSLANGARALRKEIWLSVFQLIAGKSLGLAKSALRWAGLNNGS
jgi:hypothetical protein